MSPSVKRRLCKGHHLLWVTLPFTLLFLPWLWLLGSESQIDLVTSLSSQERVAEVVQKSLRTALFAGLLSLLFAGALHALIQQTRFRKIWLLIFIIPMLLSPYTFVQGWIHWLGDQGTLSNTKLTLYSQKGLIFMLAAHFFPWALLLLQLGHRPLARNEKEFCQLASLSSWKKFRLLIWPRIGLPLVVAFLWITLQAFWSYDIPSMLRQNLISLEVMAAFGSFYDLNRALAVLINTWPIAFLPILLIVLLILHREHLKRFLEFETCPPQNTSWKDGLAATLSLLLLIIPLSGLLIQMSSLPRISETFTDAFGDFKNTLLYASLAPLLSLLLITPLLFTQRRTRTLLSSLLILGLIIPSSVLGILWLQVASLTSWPAFLEGKALMIVLLAIFLLPYTALAASVFLDSPAKAWKDLSRMTPQAHRLRWQEFLRLKRPQCGLLLIVLSLVCIREVPLILLHYPPEGGTLALTIETMLHFDQPALVAGLCLFQLLATGMLVFIFSILSYSPK